MQHTAELMTPSLLFLLLLQIISVYLLATSKRQKIHALETQVTALQLQMIEEHQALYAEVQKRHERIYRLAAVGKSVIGLLHDIANPLTYSMLFLEQKQHKKLTQVHSALHEASTLIERTRGQLLHSSYIEEFYIADEIERAISFLHHKSLYKGVSCNVKLSPKLKLVGDRYKFYQCLSNIISNAIDAYDHINSTKRRSVDISARQARQNIEIYIQDFGSGIAEKDQPCIFIPFFTTKTDDEGTGIGLAEAKEIIEQSFRGSIRFKTNIGKGTTFILTLPSLPSPTQVG